MSWTAKGTPVGRGVRVLIEAGSIEAGDVGSVTGLLETVLDRAAAGERWCNLTLEIDEDRAPASGDSVLFSFLAARGPSSPLATVMATVEGSVEVGIQHRAGVRSFAQLVEAGLRPPEGWIVRQDHPRRGLVLAVPEESPAAAIAGWLVRAMDELNRSPTTGRLRYERYAAG